MNKLVSIIMVLMLVGCGDDITTIQPEPEITTYSIAASVLPSYCGTVPQNGFVVKEDEVVALTFYNVPVYCEFQHWLNNNDGSIYDPLPNSSTADWWLVRMTQNYDVSAVFEDARDDDSN